MSQLEGTCITHLAWGQMEVCIGSQQLKFRDCKIWPGGAEEWDWNTSGTRHEPGIAAAAVEELLTKGAEVVVLSRGFHGRLGVCAETEEVLRARGIEFFAEKTPQAVELFNELAQRGTMVGGLFHSTC